VSEISAMVSFTDEPAYEQADGTWSPAPRGASLLNPAGP